MNGVDPVPLVGSISRSGSPERHRVVVPADDRAERAANAHLADLGDTYARPLTLRSYGHDIVRWFRFITDDRLRLDEVPQGLQRLRPLAWGLGEIGGQSSPSGRRDEVSAMAARIGRPFEHQGRLESLRARLVEVNEALASEVTVDALAASVPVTTTDPGPAPDAFALGRGARPVPAPVLPTLHQRHELHAAMYGPTETPPVIQA